MSFSSALTSDIGASVLNTYDTDKTHQEQSIHENRNNKKYIAQIQQCCTDCHSYTDNHQYTLVQQMLLLLRKNHTIAKAISSDYLLQTYG